MARPLTEQLRVLADRLARGEGRSTVYGAVAELERLATATAAVAALPDEIDEAEDEYDHYHMGYEAGWAEAITQVKVALGLKTAVDGTEQPTGPTPTEAAILSGKFENFDIDGAWDIPVADELARRAGRGLSWDDSDLFAVVRRNFETRRARHEAANGPVDDHTARLLFERHIVCVDHQRFIPCRTCLYRTPAIRPYSDDPDDIAHVRRHQDN